MDAIDILVKPDAKLTTTIGNSDLPHEYFPPDMSISSAPPYSSNTNVSSDNDERVKIIEALSMMESSVSWKTPAEGARFFAAEEKFWSIVLDGESQLSKMEKRIFVHKVRAIEDIRRNFMKNESEKEEKVSEEKGIMRVRCYVKTLKGLELILQGMLVFTLIKEIKYRDDVLFLIYVNVFAMIITGLFLSFYWVANTNQCKKCFSPDNLCSGIFIFGYFILTTLGFHRLNKMTEIFGITLIVLYAMEVLMKTYSLADGISPKNDSKLVIRYSTSSNHNPEP